MKYLKHNFIYIKKKTAEVSSSQLYHFSFLTFIEAKVIVWSRICSSTLLAAQTQQGGNTNLWMNDLLQMKCDRIFFLFDFSGAVIRLEFHSHSDINLTLRGKKTRKPRYNIELNADYNPSKYQRCLVKIHDKIRQQKNQLFSTKTGLVEHTLDRRKLTCFLKCCMKTLTKWGFFLSFILHRLENG